MCEVKSTGDAGGMRPVRFVNSSSRHHAGACRSLPPWPSLIISQNMLHVYFSRSVIYKGLTEVVEGGFDGYIACGGAVGIVRGHTMYRRLCMERNVVNMPERVSQGKEGPCCLLRPRGKIPKGYALVYPHHRMYT